MAGKYDPDAPEGAKVSGGGYITKKDFKVIAVVLAVLGVCAYPLYTVWKEDADKKICTTNIKQLAQAVALYVQIHDERMPVAYQSDENGLPMLVNGVPITWASQIEPNMSERAGLGCPSATPEEHCRIASLDPEKKIKELAFGFYAGLEAQPMGFINNPSDTVMIAETNNNGSRDSYNPVPFVGPNGERITEDGFLIGWDNDPDGNFGFNEDTRLVTRLAFRNMKDGNPSGENVEPRHRNGILAVFADGRIGRLQPGSAAVKFTYPVISGAWSSTILAD
jgi:hypothetical protein